MKRQVIYCDLECAAQQSSTIPLPRKIPCYRFFPPHTHTSIRNSSGNGHQLSRIPMKNFPVGIPHRSRVNLAQSRRFKGACAHTPPTSAEKVAAFSVANVYVYIYIYPSGKRPRKRVRKELRALTYVENRCGRGHFRDDVRGIRNAGFRARERILLPFPPYSHPQILPRVGPRAGRENQGG